MDTNNKPIGKPTISNFLCILGMHRSGTSVVAHFLHELGVAVAPQLLRPMEGVNPEGFWEDRQVVEINERLLSVRDCRWFDWGRVDVVKDASIESQIRQDAKDHFKKCYENYPLSLVKDPRLCRLLPFWLEVWAEARINPLFIHVVRHPLAVAQSLQKRDRIPYEYAMVLWLLHELDALWYGQAYPGLVVVYDDFLARPQALAEILVSRYGVSLPVGREGWSEVADRVINRNLQHNNNSIEAPLGLRNLHTFAISLYNALVSFAYAPVDSALIVSWRESLEQLLSSYADEMAMLARLCSDLMHLSAESVRVGELHACALAALADRDQFIRDMLHLKFWRLAPRILRKVRRA